MGSGFADAPRGAEHPARAFEARTLSPVSLSRAEGSRRGTPVRLRLWREPHDSLPASHGSRADGARANRMTRELMTTVNEPGFRRPGARGRTSSQTPLRSRVLVPSSLASRDTMHSARRTSRTSLVNAPSPVSSFTTATTGTPPRPRGSRCPPPSPSPRSPPLTFARPEARAPPRPPEACPPSCTCARGDGIPGLSACGGGSPAGCAPCAAAAAAAAAASAAASGVRRAASAVWGARPAANACATVNSLSATRRYV